MIFVGKVSDKDLDKGSEGEKEEDANRCRLEKEAVERWVIKWAGSVWATQGGEGVAEKIIGSDIN